MGFFKHIPHESFMQYLDSKLDALQKNMDELTLKRNFNKDKNANYSKYMQQYLNGDFSIEGYLPEVQHLEELASGVATGSRSSPGKTSSRT